MAQAAGLYTFEILYHQRDDQAELTLEIAEGAITEPVPDENDERFELYRNFPPYVQRQVAELRDLTDPQQLNAYIERPFEPHAIARLRLTAYQKAVFMHYIDNLLDRGDRLYRRQTRESINEAEVIYNQAARCAG